MNTMFNWKKLCSDTRGYDSLYRELTSGSGCYILDNVKMPETCANAVCSIEFRYYSDSKIVMYCSGAPLLYTGQNKEIGKWLTSGRKKFASFDELKQFLSSFSSDTSRAPAEEAEQAPQQAASAERENGSSIPSAIPEKPEMKYDKTALSIPESYKGFVKLDKDKLLLDLTSEIFGQKEVLEKIAHLVYIFLGSKGKDRPLSVFLYGTSGTGKTETAIQLTEMINRQLPKEAQHYVYRSIDCTHYTHEGDISRLTGAAPGYVGHDEGGPFSVTEDNPCVIYAINEIEKAHADITTALMEAMDTGRMATNGKTLSNGNDYYDLTSCILIFTSNVQIEDKKQLGFSGIEPCTDYSSGHSASSLPLRIIEESNTAKEKLAESGKFRKEVLGRMDAVLKFETLSGEAIIQICTKCIEKLAEKKCRLYITEIDTPLLQEFINVVASHSSGSFGARNPKLYASAYFGSQLVEFSHTHADYTCITLSGTLDNIQIRESDAPSASAQETESL